MPVWSDTAGGLFEALAASDVDFSPGAPSSGDAPKWSEILMGVLRGLLERDPTARMSVAEAERVLSEALRGDGGTEACPES